MTGRAKDPDQALNLRRRAKALAMQNEALRKAQKKLEALVAQYVDLYDLAPVGDCTVSSAGVILQSNLTLMTLLGLARKPQASQDINRYIHKEDRDKFFLLCQRLLVSDPPESCELRMVKQDGAGFWAHLAATRVQRENGNPVIRLVLSDISDRKRTDDRFRHLVESAPYGIVLVDEKGKITFVNARMEHLFGYSGKELLGQSIELLVPEGLRSAHRQLRADFLYPPSARPMGAGRDLYARRKDGAKIPVEIGLNPIETPEARMVLATIVDIAERKRMETEIERTLDAAIDTARLKSEFMANMSHEIRTPMNAVLGMAALLMETDLSPKQRKFCDVIQESGKSLLRIINEILDFSKIESGRFTVESSEMALRRSVDDVVQMLSPAAETKGVALQVSFAADIPAFLRGDAARIGQVITNLLDNAIKFTERGAVTVRAEVERQTEATVLVRVSVQDTGVGISEEDKKRLFQPFSQVGSSTTGKLGGSGLGLAISKKIVELMGGTMGMRSKLGQGSTFWFTVPFGRGASTSRRHEPDAPDIPSLDQPVILRSTPGSVGSKKARILLAEDNPANRLLTYYQLERLGYSVDIVSNGRQVLEALAATPYDLVLMDCQMPEMDGYQATAEIRKREGPSKHTLVIAMTGNVLEGEDAKCRAAGMDGYVAKPVSLKALTNLLGQWAGQPIRTGDEVGHPERDGGDPVNMSVLVEATEGKPAALRHLVRTYLDQVASRLKDLERAIQADHPGDVKTIAHNLAGSSNCFGAVLLVPTFHEMERLGKERRLAKAPALLVKALEDLEQVKRFLAVAAPLEGKPSGHAL